MMKIEQISTRLSCRKIVIKRGCYLLLTLMAITGVSAVDAMPRTPSKTSTPATNGTAYGFFAKQQIAVSGIVTESATGLPLPGVAVMEKGTYNGTVTDENGKYFLELTNGNDAVLVRSEEHTSELQSLMRISYAVFCLK